MSRAQAFDVVAQFEAALCEYTGAKYAVTVDSCTNALYLCFQRAERQQRGPDPMRPHRLLVTLPKHTYVGVAQAAINARCLVEYVDYEWKGQYTVGYTNIVDSAKHFQRDMYRPGTLTCVSFQAGKILPIGRGGAILTDNEEAAGWLRRARLDGRTAGADYSENTYQGFGAHCYLPPDAAARGLWLMTYLEDNDPCDWTAYPDLSQAEWT